MAHSYLLGGAAAGMHVRVGGPAGYQPDPADRGRAASRSPPTTGGSVSVGTDPQAAADGADVLATDTWVSMGQERRGRARRAVLAVRASTTQLLARPRADAIVLHCLPAYRGKEIAPR